MINSLFFRLREPVNQKSRRNIPDTDEHYPGENVILDKSVKTTRIDRDEPYTGETVKIMPPAEDSFKAVQDLLEDLDDKDLAKAFRHAESVLRQRGYVIEDVGGVIGNGTFYKIFRETTI